MGFCTRHNDDPGSAALVPRGGKNRGGGLLVRIACTRRFLFKSGGEVEVVNGKEGPLSDGLHSDGRTRSATKRACLPLYY